MRMKRLVAALIVGGAALVLPARIVMAQEAEHSEPTEQTSEPADEHNFATHETEECAHMLEEGKSIDDCQKAPSLILPAKNEVIWGGLAFMVVFIALARVGFPAVKKAMEDRTNRIRESLDDAERAKNEAQSVLDEYNKQLADARTEANRIIEEARQTADQLRRDLVARAEQEAQDLRQRSQEDITAAQQRAMADLQSQIRDLTIDLAEKVVQKQLDRDTNRSLIDGFIAELERA